MTDAGEVPEADRREGNRTRYLAQARMRVDDEGECQEMTPTREPHREGVGHRPTATDALDKRHRSKSPMRPPTVAAEAEVVRTKPR